MYLQLSAGMIAITPFIVELRNIPFEQQKQILFYILDRLPRFNGGAMDAGGNGAYLAEVANQQYGNIEEIKFTTEWYREEMPPYKAAFEDKAIVIPKDQDIIGDHRLVTMEGGVAKVPAGKRRKGMDGKLRHGDSAIAGALAYYAVRQKSFEYEYVAPQRQIASDDYGANSDTGNGRDDARLRDRAVDQYQSENDSFGSGAW